MTIPPVEADNMKAIPRKKRADLRKALAHPGLSIREGTLDEFYDLYALNLHSLGTPIQSKRFYKTLLTTLGERCTLTTVVHEGKAICSLMSFFWKGTVYPYYIGSAPEARVFHAYDLMYWHIMRMAVSQGITTFDFGRSKRGTGAFDYKKLWGIEPEGLPYTVKLIRAKQLPEINPLNPDYARAVVLWKKLPLWLANSLGPLLSRQIP
jgi:FemAB-related protein (PEP-CTERM system-associated)